MDMVFHTKNVLQKNKKKVINPRPKIKIINYSKSISYIDVDNSIFVAADLAIKKAIDNAKKSGIGMVAVKNSGYYGLSGITQNRLLKT